VALPQRTDLIPADAPEVVSIVFVVREFDLGGQALADSSPGRPNPHHSGGVPEDGSDIIVVE
jgi:hypothetical protein